MTSLTRYEGDGLEFYISKAGEVFATNGGIARMCDVGESTLRMWMGAQKYTALKHKMYIEQQVKGARSVMVKQTVSLYNEDAITLALEHFNPERLRVWAQIGIRAMAHKLTGWFKVDHRTIENNYYLWDDGKECLARFEEIDWEKVNDLVVTLNKNPEGYTELRLCSKYEHYLTFFVVDEDLDGVNGVTAFYKELFKMFGKKNFV